MYEVVHQHIHIHFLLHTLTLNALSMYHTPHMSPHITTTNTTYFLTGKVEDAGPDDDCYELFCASDIGKRSGACLNGNVHVFNVNESESLGPYMARYLGEWLCFIVLCCVVLCCAVLCCCSVFQTFCD